MRGWHKLLSVSADMKTSRIKVRGVLVAGSAALLTLSLAARLASAAPHRRVAANVAIHIAAAPAPASVGADLDYTLTVRNLGPARARSVVVRDRLPDSTTFVSATSSRGSCAGTQPVVCSLGALPRGTVTRITIVVSPTQNGHLVNRAIVWALQPDRTAWDISASLSTLVRPAVNLGVSGKALPRPARFGQPLTYTFTVRNLSSADATNVVLKDRIPARSQLVSASASQGSCGGTATISCALGTLVAGASAQVTIVVTPSGLGYVANHVSVSGDQPDPQRFNNARMIYVHVKAAP
jgi:uncharacterized repeat protein (TIGR01451 family)